MTPPPGVTLRAGEPGDASHFAALAEAAGGGMWRALLGARAPDLLAKVFAEPDHDLSMDRTTWAWDTARTPDRRLGMLQGFSGRSHDESGPRTVSVLMRHLGLRAVLSLPSYVAARPLLEFMDEVPGDDWYVQMVAVDPDARGRGVGTLLMAEAERQAAAAHCSRLALDVDTDNAGARRLYERLGYQVIAESPAAPILGDTRVLRMVRSP